MTTKLSCALALAKKGFYVFPIKPYVGDGRQSDGKEPAIRDFPHKATRDPEQITTWWNRNLLCNVGISTSHFGDDIALLVVDVDVKKGKDGNKTILQLEIEGYEFPTTLEHVTASGGRHLVYRVPAPVKQGVDVFGEGLDVRSRGGYVLGPGSDIAGKLYTIGNKAPIADAPKWMVQRCGVSSDADVSHAHERVAGVDDNRAEVRALDYVRNAPAAAEGSRNQAAFRVAAHIKDLGASQPVCLALMAEHWRCDPPLDDAELAHVVKSAYTYGKDAQGSAAPEAAFSSVSLEAALTNPEMPGNHPFDVLNREFAFVLAGGGAHILWETVDKDDEYDLQHLAIGAFHMKLASYKMQIGKTQKPVTDLWMESTARRSYDGLVFAPEQEVSSRFYNMWRGFNPGACEVTDEGRWAMRAFSDHLNTNVCAGDLNLAKWLWGFFAHLIQRPWEKPSVALVMKGRKGVGKNVACEHVGALFAPHFMVAEDDRYLLSNFNGHMEKLLFLVLDEAHWAGDKRAEGRLKGLITGSTHNIEHKGKESYQVANLTRVAILGNEDWLVPATDDERRFAVFTVGDNRKEDTVFFDRMERGMRTGGYCLLLEYLKTYDLTGINVNRAPQTSGLIEQKHASLEPCAQWWLDCMQADQILGGDFNSRFPTTITMNRLRDAYARYSIKRNIRSRLPTDAAFGAFLRRVAPHMIRSRSNDDVADYVYKNGGIDILRADWERFIGGPVIWGD